VVGVDDETVYIEVLDVVHVHSCPVREAQVGHDGLVTFGQALQGPVRVELPHPYVGIGVHREAGALFGAEVEEIPQGVPNGDVVPQQPVTLVLDGPHSLVHPLLNLLQHGAVIFQGRIGAA